MCMVEERSELQRSELQWSATYSSPHPTLWFTNASLAEKNVMFIFIMLLNGMISSWKPHIYISSRTSVQRPDFTTFPASVGTDLSVVKRAKITLWCLFTPVQMLFNSWEMKLELKIEQGAGQEWKHKCGKMNIFWNTIKKESKVNLFEQQHVLVKVWKNTETTGKVIRCRG